MIDRSRRFAVLGLLLALAVLAAPPPRRPAQAQTAVPLHEAVAQNLVIGQITASNGAPGELALMLEPAGDPLMIAIPPGTRFVPDSDDVAEVVSIEPIEILIQDATTIDPLHVATLISNRAAPSPMNSAEYAVGGQADEPLLVLLTSLAQRQPADDLAAQLAVWAVYANRSVDDVNAGLAAPMTTEDVAAARQLVAGLPAPPPSPTSAQGTGETLEPDATATPENGGSNGGSFPFGLLLGGVVVVAAAVISIAYIAQRKSPSPAMAEDVYPAATGGAAKPKPVPPPKKASARSDKPITESIDRATGLTLVGTSGPLAGARLVIEQAAIVARNDVPVQALHRDGLTSPHVYLYWSTQDVSVRDLNSDGTSLESPPLDPNDKVPRVAFGSSIRLGGRVSVALTVDGIQLGDRIIPAPAGQMILSRDPLPVRVVGEADKRVSNPHCLVRREGANYLIRDLNSSNGVWLNGERIGAAEATIPPGAVVQLGDSQFSRADG